MILERKPPMSQRAPKIDGILDYRFPGWLLATAVVVLIVAVRFMIA
jgi:hypothetical protein